MAASRAALNYTRSKMNLGASTLASEAAASAHGVSLKALVDLQRAKIAATSVPGHGSREEIHALLGRQ
jgi:hypothetical protein